MTNTPKKGLAFLTGTFNVSGIENGIPVEILGPDNTALTIPDPSDPTGKAKLITRAGVRSQQSKHFQAFLKAQSQKMVGKGRRARNSAVQEAMFTKEQEEAEAKAFSNVVTWLENLGEPGRVIVSEEDLFAFAMDPVNGWFVSQLNGFSANQGNYGLDSEGNGEEAGGGTSSPLAET